MDKRNCKNCERWMKGFIYPYNDDVHWCERLEIFTADSFYCSEHESRQEMLDRIEEHRFLSEYDG